MNKISIIGGSGFVGTNLCRFLKAQGQEFEILDIKPSKQFPNDWKYADVRDPNTLRKTLSGNIVVNLAAVHRDDVSDRRAYWDTNVDGAKHVCNICSQLGIRKIVFTSSVAVYGEAPDSTDETGELRPINDYGRSKLEAEQVFENWDEDVGNSLIIIRPTVIFGEGNRGNVYNLFNQVNSGKFLMIGKGQNKKSMAYKDNFVAFLSMCILKTPNSRVFNYVDTPNCSVEEIVKAIRLKLHSKDNVGIRLPYGFGLMIGYIWDALAWALNKKFAISSVRIRKFVMSSEFVSSRIDLEDFERPFGLLDGIERTLDAEFINPDENREVFFTE